MKLRGRESSEAVLSIVIPVFNEVQNIAPLLGEVAEVTANLPFATEIIVVDDGSTDGTGAEVVRAGEEIASQPDVSVTLVQLKRNMGQSVAMAVGIDLAAGDMIVTLDGDGQNDPAVIPKLLRALQEGYDVVCGWRRRRQDAFLIRILPSRAANWLISHVTSVRVHDVACTLRAYRASTIKEVARQGLMHRYIPVQCQVLGASIAEVEVPHRPRLTGRSKYGLRRVFNVLLDLPLLYFLSRYSQRPYAYFARVGFLLVLLNVVALMLIPFLIPHPSSLVPLSVGVSLLILSVAIGSFAELTMRADYSRFTLLQSYIARVVRITPPSPQTVTMTGKDDCK